MADGSNNNGDQEKMIRTNKKDFKFVFVTVVMCLLLTAIYTLCRFDNGAFRAKAEEDEKQRFSITEINEDCDFTVARLTEHKTLIYLESIEFTPPDGMTDKFVAGEKTRVTITNEADEWAKMALTYNVDGEKYTLDGPVNWEWREFYNDEYWRISLEVYRPNDVTISYDITDIVSVKAYYALPDCKYNQVKTVEELVENEATAKIVKDAVNDVLEKAANDEDPVAYMDYYLYDFGDQEAEFSGENAPYSSEVLNAKPWLRKLLFGVCVVGAVVAAGLLIAGTAVVSTPLIIAGLAVAGAALVSGVTSIIVENNLDEPIQAMTEEEAKRIAENIEFTPDGDEESESNIIALNLTGEDGVTHALTDHKGRRLYYNKKTRYVGNSSYCVLDYADMSFVKFELDAKKITSVNGNRLTANKDMQLVNESNQNVVSFTDKKELSDQTENKPLGVIMNLDSYMIQLSDVNGQTKKDKEQDATKSWLDNIAGKIGSGFGCPDVSWKVILRWVIAIVALILVIVFIGPITGLLKIIWAGIKAVFKGIKAAILAVGRFFKKIFSGIKSSIENRKRKK